MAKKLDEILEGFIEELGKMRDAAIIKKHKIEGIKNSVDLVRDSISLKDYLAEEDEDECFDIAYIRDCPFCIGGNLFVTDEGYHCMNCMQQGDVIDYFVKRDDLYVEDVLKKLEEYIEKNECL